MCPKCTQTFSKHVPHIKHGLHSQSMIISPMHISQNRDNNVVCIVDRLPPGAQAAAEPYHHQDMI